MGSGARKSLHGRGAASCGIWWSGVRDHWERGPRTAGAGARAHLWRTAANGQPARAALSWPQQPEQVIALANFCRRDAFCHLTSYLYGHELLDLRCQSKHCRDAIRHAAGSHAGCSRVLFRSTRSMEARMHVARAFGHACRHLAWSTSASDQADWAREDDFLVEWCRSAPNLVHLDASSSVHQYGESRCHW